MRSTSRRSRTVALLGAAVLALGTTTLAVQSSVSPAGAAGTSSWLNTSRPAEERARALVEQLSLEQQVDVIDQNSGTGVPEFGIPPIRSIDGCCGVTATVPTTAMPAGIALASTFSPELATRYGAVLGDEAHQTGFNSIAGPTLDLTRTPFNGRMWETYGEDTLLTGTMATAQVQGEQTSDVWAIPKHYNLNNQETRRGHVSSQVDERTFNEVYSLPWERLISEAQPGAVMCSFNRVNTVYGCSSADLLQKTLKDRLGLEGYVTSDFDAGHSFADYQAGLDVSGPAETYAGTALVAAVRNGTVPEARVTDAAYRVLLTMIRTGVYDNPPPGAFTVPTPPQPSLGTATLGRGNATAAEVGDATAVLLKNDDGALPLAGGTGTRSMAVIGPDADYYVAGGGAGAVTTPNKVTTILDGLRTRAASDGITTTYASGTDSVGLGDTMPGPAPVASSALSPANGSNDQGLVGQYFLSRSFQGTPFATRTDTQVNIRSGIGADFSTTSRVAGLGFPLITAGFSARWTGRITAPTTGTYELSLSHLGSAKLFVDGQQLITDAGATYGTQKVGVPMVAGQARTIRIDYVTDAPGQFDGGLNDQPGPMIRFGWTLPEGAQPTRIQQAVAAARTADVAVVVARDYTSEASDRGTLSLPQQQDRLIEAVAAVNPRTVVVLATSGPVLMPWLSKVDAVLESWYGGQAQGRTVARTLFGDVNPSGKLPVTFPASEAQVDQVGARNPFRQLNETNPVETYDEGVLIGYKGYDKAGITPLFPFGHGLSYTSFRYSGLTTTPTATGLSATFTLTNTGAVRGTEVPQVYVDAPADPEVPMPVRSLVGYDRVTLDAGQSRSVTVDVDTRELSYWSVADNGWRLPRGDRTVEVGSSSRDLRLSAARATAGVFAPSIARTPDVNGWYTSPVVVSGQVTGVGGAGSCTPVTYGGPDGRAVPVTVTCTAPGAGTSTHVVTIDYDATAPGASITKPARARRVASWRTLRGTADAGTGAPITSVDVRVVEKRARGWFAYRDGRWRTAPSRAAALSRATSLSATQVDGRWTQRLTGLHQGRLLVTTTVAEAAGHRSTVTRSQRLR